LHSSTRTTDPAAVGQYGPPPAADPSSGLWRRIQAARDVAIVAASISGVLVAVLLQVGYRWSSPAQALHDVQESGRVALARETSERQAADSALRVDIEELQRGRALNALAIVELREDIRFVALMGCLQMQRSDPALAQQMCAERLRRTAGAGR
jgi:hypothetical protein